MRRIGLGIYSHCLVFRVSFRPTKNYIPPTNFDPIENPAPNLAGDAIDGRYVSRIENVAAAVNDIIAISSRFNDRLGIANATIATIKP